MKLYILTFDADCAVVTTEVDSPLMPKHTGIEYFGAFAFHLETKDWYQYFGDHRWGLAIKGWIPKEFLAAQLLLT